MAAMLFQFYLFGGMAIYCMENNVGTDFGYIVGPIWACGRPQIIVFHMDKAPNYRGKRLTKAKKSKYTSRNIRSSTA